MVIRDDYVIFITASAPTEKEADDIFATFYKLGA